MSKTLTVEHNEKTYEGQFATITGTLLGYEDHGILTAYVYTEWPSGGIGVGGYALDQWVAEKGKRVPSAYGLDQLVRIMEVVGVSSWEELVGQKVIVLFDMGRGGMGNQSVGLASATDDTVLILSEHSNEWEN